MSSGRKLVSHRVVKPWQLMSVSYGRKLVFSGLVASRCCQLWEEASLSWGCEAVAATVFQLREEASFSWGCEALAATVCQLWEGARFSWGCEAPLHCTAQQASAASFGRKLVFPIGMQGPILR